MSIFTRVFHILMGILMVAALSSCGGDKSKSDQTKITLLPSKPIVITADVQENDKTITAPWFRFAASLFNPTDEPITIVALQVEVTGLNNTGQQTTATVAFSPGSFNTTIPNGNSSIECKYDSFGTIAAGQSGDFGIDNGVTGCPKGAVQFTVGNNPKGPPGNTNYRYTLKVKPLGWFGELLTPTDRFEKKDTFYTQ